MQDGAIRKPSKLPRPVVRNKFVSSNEAKLEKYSKLVSITTSLELFF